MNTQPAVRRAIARLAETLRDTLPDARIETRADGVAIEGARLRARLRWVGGLLK